MARDSINLKLAEIVDSIGSANFFDEVAEIISSNIPYDGMFIFLYDEKNAPAALGCYKLACDYKDGLDNFIKYTYVLNPVYRAFLDANHCRSAGQIPLRQHRRCSGSRNLLAWTYNNERPTWASEE